MKKTKILFAVLAVLIMIYSFCGCSTNNKTAIETIKERGKLIIGTEAVGQSFNYRDINGEFSGLEIDMGKKLAKEILGNENAVEFVVLTATDRPIMLDSGEVDIVLSTYTITEERLEATDFSYPYYNDNTGLIVMTDSGIARFSDLDGKTIGVLQSTAVAETMKVLSEEHGYNIDYPEYTSYGDLKAALSAGRIDAFASNVTILQTYLDDDTTILGEAFGAEPYGIGVKKGSDLLDAVNGYITEWIADGTMDVLIENNNLPAMNWDDIEIIAKDLGLAK